MVGFLRRKSSPKAKPGTDTGVTVSKKSTSSSNPPPALPPLFHSRTSKSSSSPHGPEPDVAPSSSQPGPSKEDIPAGASTSPVLLPTVAPLTTSIEDDVDWQALIQFIDAPALLSDSITKPSQEATPPPAAEKKLPGAALVTSNRYLSQAQKTRLAREQSSKLNNARPKVHKDEPLALPLLFNGSPKNNGSNVTPTSTFLIAPDSFTDRRDVRTTPLVKEDPQGRAGPDPGAQGDGKTGGVSDCGNATVKKENRQRDRVLSGGRREEASPILGSLLSIKNSKQIACDSKATTTTSKNLAVPAENGSGRIVSKVTDALRDGKNGVPSSRLTVRSLVGAARSSVVGNGHTNTANTSKKPNGSANDATKLHVSANGKPAMEALNAKPGIDASSNGKRGITGMSDSEHPRVNVLEWQAGVKAAKESETARRAKRISSSTQHSRSARPHTAPGPAPSPNPLSQPHLRTDSHSRSRSPPPNLPHPSSRHSTASPMSATTMTNEKTIAKINAGTAVVVGNMKTTVPPTSYPEQRMSGHSDQRSMAQGQHRNRTQTQVQGQRPVTSDGSAHSHGHGRDHSHRRSTGSDQAYNLQSDKVNGHTSPQSAYPAAVGAFSPSTYPVALPNTSFCPTAFSTATFNPFAYGAGAPGAMYNPYNPYQAFAFGAGAYPTPSPSPGPYVPAVGGGANVGFMDPTGKMPGLHKSPSATSFFESVMAGVHGVSNVPGGQGGAHQNGSRKMSGGRSAHGDNTSTKDKDNGKPRVLTKVRPIPPPTPPHVTSTNEKIGRSRKDAYDDSDSDDTDDGLRKACALLDSDPFAKTGGVHVMMTWNDSSGSSKDSGSVSGHGHETPARPSYLHSTGHRPALVADLRGAVPVQARPDPQIPPSPEEYQVARQQRRGLVLGKEPPPVVAESITQRGIRQSVLLDGTSGPEVIPDNGTGEVEVEVPPKYFPLLAFLSRPAFLAELMEYLEFKDWVALYAVGRRSVRALFDTSAAPPSSLRHSFTGIRGFRGVNERGAIGASNARQLKEIVLERFLRPVGYAKWEYEWAEPIVLSLRDLHNYMRGISLPTHDYARLARAYLELPKGKDSQGPDVFSLALTTRAYTKVVLRLRAQAESEARVIARLREEHGRTCSVSCQQRGRLEKGGCVSSRSSSPTSSSHHQPRNQKKTHARQDSSSTSTSASSCTCSHLRPKFHSPLFRPNRTALLRVFVPSPDGTWLSTGSVEECEAELRRSGTGVAKLLRVGDVVWDVALGDEGNVGRMVWDGGYLVDLDYKYSRLGELSPYFHSLAFSPSYFHRVIRIGASAGHNPQANPIVYVDVSPWGKEISENLQLLQERSKTETPSGALHDVVLWVHRSSFTIRRPANSSNALAHSHLQETYPHLIPRAQRVPIPNVPGFFVDPNWYGKVVVEAEGTNEGLVDLQERCGPGVFPPHVETIAKKIRGTRDNAQAKKMWRVVRERSRPGEIFLRAVTEKERVMW